MPKLPEPEKRLYTLKEAARYLGRSDWGMRELMWAGEIPFVRTEGGRKIILMFQTLTITSKKIKRFSAERKNISGKFKGRMHPKRGIKVGYTREGVRKLRKVEN